ncbi:MAG: putative nucleotidyltransferase substrate binding domain-containing protein, partial [Deltaproteobacteria bacterium]|nr:putative nucleotidyltransferase substrate binding domain-containing protein [Deltaproteobacteria bacterium]
FFLEVGSYCRREVITCNLTDRLVDAAALMQQLNISSLVVCDEGIPSGILTDRDLRNKVVAKGIDPAKLVASDVMNAPIISIGEDEPLYEALHLLSLHKIHRLVVTDRTGRLAGIITDSDILRIQSRSPHQLIREIEEATTTGELKVLHQRVQNLVVHLIGTGVRIRDLVRLIAHLNDRIIVRLIHLLRSGSFSCLSDRFAFVVLGSEGRGGQTLTTDQDNALIHADDLSTSDVMNLKQFSQELIDTLIAIGVPSCPGGIMAKNDQWFRNLSQWREVFDQWLSIPTPENIHNVSTFSDMRILSGDKNLEQDLKSHVRKRLVDNQAFLGHMTADLLRFNVPLGWFGNIKTDKGDHFGQVDLKKAGIFAITEGVKILALSKGIQEYGTLERLEALKAAGELSDTKVADLTAAFDTLVYFRLRTQVDAVREERQPDNSIIFDRLNRMEQEHLRSALEMVSSLHDLLQRRFPLG